jgi:hypothetical protein
MPSTARREPGQADEPGQVRGTRQHFRYGSWTLARLAGL